jgi:hypothetical protein
MINAEIRALIRRMAEPPTGPWIVRQLREAFPEAGPYRHMILDRDARFGAEVTDLLTAGGVNPKRISAAGPWQKRDMFFAWAGGTNPGDPHYYRIQTSAFLIEFDDTQDNANHIHSVWRDLRNDFGGDLLRAHYETGHHRIEG